MPRAPTSADWATLLLLTVFWGTAFMFNELALSSFGPSVLVAGRVLLAAACLFALLRLTGVRLPPPGPAWLPLGAMALLGTVLPFHLTAWAQQHIDSAVAGVLMAVMPLFVLTLAHIFVPGARITPPRALGFAMGFAGVAVLIGPDALRGLSGNTTLLGSLAVLGAAFSYALNTVLARRVAVSDPLALATGTLLAASVLAMPTAIVATPSTSLAPSGVAVGAVLFLGLLSTGLATVLYFRLIQGPGPTFVSLVNYIVPGWAVIAGALVLGEALTVHVYAGLALILASIAISEFGGSAGALLSRLWRKHAAARAALAREDA